MRSARNLAALLACLAGAATAHAAPYTVTYAQLGASVFSVGSDNRFHPATNSPSAQTLSDAASISYAGASGNASFSQTADFGNLHAFMTGSATGSPLNQSFVTFGSFAAETAPQFYDSITVRAPGLPDGTPVTVTFTASLDGSATGNAGPNGSTYNVQGYYDASAGPFSVRLFLTGAGPRTYTATGTVNVGATYSVLGATVFDISGTSGFASTADATIDVSHTATLAVDPVTPGVQLVADSGHDYSLAALPEPSAAACSLLALAAPALARRRRHS
jgi:hypothetical protein